MRNWMGGWVIYLCQEVFRPDGLVGDVVEVGVFTCSTYDMCMTYFNALQTKNEYSKGRFYSYGRIGY